MNTYFRYCEANNKDPQRSYNAGNGNIGFECETFESEEEATKAGYVRLLHDVKPEEKPKAEKKRKPKAEKVEDDNENG